MVQTKRAIIDASAIIAVLSDHDQWHRSAEPIFLSLPEPFYTCESAVSEACFKLHPEKWNVLFELFENGIVEIGFSLTDELDNVSRLISKYKSVPMSFTDACLVRMSEIFDAPVFTFDSDFAIYRRNRNKKIPLLGLED